MDFYCLCEESSDDEYIGLGRDILTIHTTLASKWPSTDICTLELPLYSTHEKAPPLQLLQYSPTTWSGADFNLNQIEVELDDVFAQFEELEIKDFRYSPALSDRSSSVESTASNDCHYEPCATKESPADRPCSQRICGEVSSKEPSGDHPGIHQTAATQKIHPCACSVSYPTSAKNTVRRDTLKSETEAPQEHIAPTRVLLKNESLPPVTVTTATQDELPGLNALHDPVTASLNASSFQAGHGVAVPGPGSLSVQSRPRSSAAESTSMSAHSEENFHVKLDVMEHTEQHDWILSRPKTLCSLETTASNIKSWVDNLMVSGISTARKESTEEPLEGSSCHDQSSYGESSPAEGHSDIADSDLLSVSDTSEPGLCSNFGPLTPMQHNMLSHILRDHREWKRCHGVDNAYVTPAESRTSSLSSSSNSQTNSGKRKPSDHMMGIDSGRSLKVTKRAREETTRPRVLACPYWKHDQDKYRLCCKLSHKRIRDVKQHLHRRHTPDIYCDRCLEVFDNAERYETHVQSTVACFRAADSRLEGITRMQSRAISKKSDRNLGEEDQWFVIWDILFPGVARPAAAYVDSELTEEMNSFQEYWTKRGRDILMDELNSNCIWSLSPEEREAQGRQILAGGLNSIYEQWSELRRSASTAPSDPSMPASPPTSSAAAITSGFTPSVNNAPQAPTIVLDPAESSSATVANSRVGKSQPPTELSQPGPRTPPIANANGNQCLALGETPERNIMPEREQIEFNGFGFTDFHNIETTEDLDFDFDF